MQFSSKHLLQQTSWERILFSDESWFELGSIKKSVWRRRGDYRPEVCRSESSHPPKVLIWGAVGHGFKSNLVFVDETVSADTYINKILIQSGVIEHANAFHGVENWWFQQDNARAHVAERTISFLRSKKVRILEDWPPYSPDLNIIEIVWAIMDHKVEKRRPRTVAELKDIIIEVWNCETFDTINALVSSMPKRLRKVIMNQGRPVHGYKDC